MTSDSALRDTRARSTADVPPGAVTFRGYDDALLAARRVLRDPQKPSDQASWVPTLDDSSVRGIAEFLVHAANRDRQTDQPGLAVVDARDVHAQDAAASVCHSYGELRDQAAALARFMQCSCGISQGDRVGYGPSCLMTSSALLDIR